MPTPKTGYLSGRVNANIDTSESDQAIAKIRFEQSHQQLSESLVKRIEEMRRAGVENVRVSIDIQIEITPQ